MVFITDQLIRAGSNRIHETSWCFTSGFWRAVFSGKLICRWLGDGWSKLVILPNDFKKCPSISFDILLCSLADLEGACSKKHFEFGSNDGVVIYPQNGSRLVFDQLGGLDAWSLYPFQCQWPNNSPTPLKFNSYCGISWYAVNHKLHMISESSQTRGDQGIWSRIVETPELISRSFDVFENIWRTLLHRFALLDVFQRHGKLACDLQSWIQESSPMKLHEGSCYMPKGAKRPSGLVVVRHLQNVGYTHRLQAQSRLHSEIWLQSSIYIYICLCLCYWCISYIYTILCIYNILYIYIYISVIVYI